MSDESKAVSRRFHEAIGKGDASAVEAELAPDFVASFPGVRDPLDAEGFKQVVDAFAVGFPDSRFSLEDEFVAGNKVVARWTWRAVHRGEFQSMPPTGRRVTLRGISVLRLMDDKISEHTVEFDRLDLLQQLGALGFPAPEGAR